MTNNFNVLTPAQAERLAILAEECGEVIQAITKILRHGYDSHHPKDTARHTNRGALYREIVDVTAAMMMVSLDIPELRVTGPDTDTQISTALAKKLQWCHHQLPFDEFVAELKKP